MRPANERKADDKNKNIQKMATFLRDGNTLLSAACPQCNSPLFKLKTGEIFCVTCDRKVIIIKNEEQIEEIVQNDMFNEFSKTLNLKINQLHEKIDLEKDIDELYKLTRLLIAYLEALGKLKELQIK